MEKLELQKELIEDTKHLYKENEIFIKIRIIVKFNKRNGCSGLQTQLEIYIQNLH